MKITATEVTTLREALAPLDTESRREAYRNGDFPRSESVKDIDKRYRWDLFWAAFNVPNWNVRSILATGKYEDSHIYTALRSIIPPLNQK